MQSNITIVNFNACCRDAARAYLPRSYFNFIALICLFVRTHKQEEKQKNTSSLKKAAESSNLTTDDSVALISEKGTVQGQNRAS